MTRRMWLTGRSDSARRQAGLTLLELLATITILVILATTLPVVLSSGAPRHEDSVRTVVGVLRQARAEALQSGEPAAVMIDVVGRRIGVAESLLELPKSVILSAETAEEARGADGLPAILFFPDGGATGGAVTVKTPGRITEIGVRWLTGEVRRRDLQGELRGDLQGGRR